LFTTRDWLIPESFTDDLEFDMFVNFRDLYKFEGNIELENEEMIPITEASILLRGARLKNSTE
jgi:hypothetical protein